MTPISPAFHLLRYKAVDSQLPHREWQALAPDRTNDQPPELADIDGNWQPGLPQVATSLSSPLLFQARITGIEGCHCRQFFGTGYVIPESEP
jgi:hypothetical protein